MSKTIALLVTLDTKDQEAEFLKQQIEARGHQALLLDIGVVGIAGIQADVDRSTVVATGGGDLAALSDVLIAVPSHITMHIQECHIAIGHAITARVETLCS